jgi:hypothetical protein
MAIADVADMTTTTTATTTTTTANRGEPGVVPRRGAARSGPPSRIAGR